MSTMPAPIRAAVALIALPLLAASLVLLWVAGTTRPFVWSVFGFEVISACACVIALVMAWRRPSADAALGLLCVAGTIGIGSLLGYFGTNPHVVGPFRLAPWLLARVAGAGALTALGVVVALAGHSEAWSRLIKGVLLGLPVIGLAAMMALDRFRSPAMGWISSLPGIVLTLGGIVAFLVITGLLAASVHMTIGAFASARQPSST